MNKAISAAVLTIFSLFLAFFLLTGDDKGENSTIYRGNKPRKKKTKAQRAFFSQQRVKYEFDMLKDGGTGKFPSDIKERELSFAKRIPLRDRSDLRMLSPFADNTYQAAGPENFGGRTRTLAYDSRFGTGGNQVIIAGAVSGGIFRSTNGGNSWTNVTPENEIHNVTSIAQDPRPGKQDIWYAGGGEALGNSASPSAGGAFYLGNGLLKSTDNGATWQRIANTFQGSLEVFDAAFDIVHKIAVNPANGHVYVAGHRRLMRSTDEGGSFQEVFAGAQAASADNGQMDVAITGTGRIYLAVNGGFADQNRRGLWLSESGNVNSYVRFAGGQTLNQDSITGWRGNSYTNSGAISTISKRILIALAPSNNNILYAMYENGLSQEGASGSPEADLFKFDFSTSTFTNLSPNMPNFPGQKDGIDPLALQGGYNMLLAVKPDNPNAVFVGGTNLYRSTSGFTNTTATSWIGGYKYWGSAATTFEIDFYNNHHPDVHALAFDPSNPNRALCGTDGGMHVTTNIMSSANETQPVTWNMITGYQTAQYYHVNIQHNANGAQANNFIGGMQDNGVYFRTGNSNNHVQAGSGDGGAAAIGMFSSFDDYTIFVTSQLGSLVRLVPGEADAIEPNGLTSNPGGGEGEFVTYFKLDNDNTQHLYYVNFNRLFRTTAARSVTSSSGWTELTGVAAKTNSANPAGNDIGIRAIALTHGPYTSSSTMFIGTTEGRVFRLNDPKSTDPSTQPVEITPPGISAMLNSARVNVGGIAVNPNNDNEIMVVYTNYQVTVGGTVRTDFNIWTTGNAKAANPTWNMVEGNLTLPSVRSCAIVARKDQTGNEFTEYYVGTSVGLYSAISIRDSLTANKPIVWKREGGRTLNYAVVASLAYRPQDNVLLVGTHGNGMYYTTIPSPNFKPNVGTGVDDPVRNDKNFIRISYPTIPTGELFYQVGNMFEVKELVVQVYNLNGQLLMKKTGGYQNGSVDVSRLSRGTYILTITSNDFRQQYVKKFVKQ